VRILAPSALIAAAFSALIGIRERRNPQVSNTRDTASSALRTEYLKLVGWFVLAVFALGVGLGGWQIYQRTDEVAESPPSHGAVRLYFDRPGAVATLEVTAEQITAGRSTLFMIITVDEPRTIDELGFTLQATGASRPDEPATAEGPPLVRQDGCIALGVAGRGY
jgi:hypothetical protein